MSMGLQERVLLMSDADFEEFCCAARDLHRDLAGMLRRQGQPRKTNVMIRKWQASEKLYRDIREGLKTGMTHEQVVAKVQMRLILEGRGQVIPMHH